MITNDYRNTEYCPVLKDVEEKKNELEKLIQLNHPKQRIIYNKVRLRGTQYNQSFSEIYNSKCAYCGVSMEVLPSTLFEIDHFVAESLFGSKTEAGKIKNLVLSCYQCNRHKREFEISGTYINMLNTDDGSIADIFYRDDEYYIRIKDEYKEDKTIKGFYDQLQLINQSRRLDYLLINMKGLYKKIEGTSQGGKLAEAILKLQTKRNKFVEH